MHYWDFLGPLLTRAVNLIFPSGIMPADWTEGIIYMIPKSDAQCDGVSKWRPITLLNVVCKIVEKIIAIRLRHVLSSIIHDTI
mgnify:CR=1 FL=1